MRANQPDVSHLALGGLLVVGGGRTELLGVVLWDEPDHAPRLRDVPEAPPVVRDAVVDTEAQVLRRLERTLAEPDQVSMRQERREIPWLLRPILGIQGSDAKAERRQAMDVRVVAGRCLPECLPECVGRVGTHRDARADQWDVLGLEPRVVSGYDRRVRELA